MARLTYVYHTDFDPSNAHGNQIIHTCNALTRLGHNVTLLAAGNPHEYARANNLSIEFEVVHTGTTGKDTTSDRLRYYLSALFRSRSDDVLFTRDVSFLRVLAHLPSWVYPLTIYEAHKAYSGIGEIGSDEERNRVEAVDGVLTIARPIATDLESLGISVDAVVPDAASASLVPDSDSERLEDKLAVESASVFVYAGSISAWKNDLELVIEGFSLIVDDVRAKLVVVGGTDDEIADLREIAEEHGVENDVTFVGRVPQEDVFEYLAVSDVGFVPLRDSDRIASHYTSPLKLYEYLVCGLKVVASDVPTIADVAVNDESIHLYENANVDDFADTSLNALDASISNPRETGAYEYTYERRADQIDEVISNLTNSWPEEITDESQNGRTKPRN